MLIGADKMELDYQVLKTVIRVLASMKDCRCDNSQYQKSDVHELGS